MGSDDAEDSYSEIANAQLDELASSDVDLYNDVLTVCESIFQNPARAQSMSTAIQTREHHIVLRLPVPGRPPYKVFWTTKGPRIEAVFPHP